jgi:hypothetical protein
LSNAVHAGGALTAAEKNDLAAYLLQIDDAETQSTLPQTLTMTTVPTGTGQVIVTVTPGLLMTRVDVYVNGVAAAQAQTQPDGTYRATITLPSGATLEARGTRTGGGLSILTLSPPTGLSPPGAPSNLRIIRSPLESASALGDGLPPAGRTVRRLTPTSLFGAKDLNRIDRSGPACGDVTGHQRGSRKD